MAVRGGYPLLPHILCDRRRADRGLWLCPGAAVHLAGVRRAPLHRVHGLAGGGAAAGGDDRKRVVEGKAVAVRVALAGRRLINNKQEYVTIRDLASITATNMNHTSTAPQMPQ